METRPARSAARSRLGNHDSTPRPRRLLGPPASGFRVVSSTSVPLVEDAAGGPFPASFRTFTRRWSSDRRRPRDLRLRPTAATHYVSFATRSSAAPRSGRPRSPEARRRPRDRGADAPDLEEKSPGSEFRRLCWVVGTSFLLSERLAASGDQSDADGRARGPRDRVRAPPSRRRPRKVAWCRRRGRPLSAG